MSDSIKPTERKEPRQVSPWSGGPAGHHAVTRDEKIAAAVRASGDTRPLAAVDPLEITLGGSGVLRPALGDWRGPTPAPRKAWPL